MTGWIIAAIVCMSIISIVYQRVAGWWNDPLWRYDLITDDEALLLTVIDEGYYADLLEYIRTMQMTQALQDYLKDNKEALESISYYMMLQVARADQEKKERWEKERQESQPKRNVTHSERMILQRLRRQ